MKNFLRGLSVTLALALVLIASMLGVMATVESTAVIYGDRVNLSEVAGSTFDVGFHFKENNTAIEVGKINLSWDAQKVEATGVAAAGALTADGVDFVSTIDNENGKATIAWVGSSIGSDVASGDLFNVTFDKSNLGEDIVSIAVEVESLGYSALFVPYNVAESVTASGAVAASGDSVEINEGDDVAAKLNQAVELAGAVDEVEVTLNTTWTLTKDVTIGNVENVPAGKIVIGGTGAIDVDGFYLALAANVEIDEIQLLGNNYSGNTKDAIFVTEGGSITIADTIRTDSGNRLNIAGSKVVVNAGQYYGVMGTVRGVPHGLTSTDVTIQGTAKVSYFVGGSYNNNNSNALTGKTKGAVLGNAQVINYCLGGSWYSDNTVHGGELTVDTTNTINQLIAAGSGTSLKAATGDDYQYVLNWISGTVSNGWSSSMVRGESTSYVNAKINMSATTTTSGYLGVTSGATGSDPFKITAYGKVEFNLLDGGSVKDVYAGSYMRVASSFSDMDITLNYLPGSTAAGTIYLGSYMNQDKCSTSGDVTLNIGSSESTTGATITTNIYMGGYAYTGATNATTSHNSTVVAYNSSLYSVYGARLKESGVQVSGNNSVELNNCTVSANCYVGCYADAGSDNSKVTGSFTFTANGTSLASLYGGSYCVSKNFEHAASTTLNFKNGSTSGGIYGGSNFTVNNAGTAAAEGSIHSGNTVVNAYKDPGDTSTYSLTATGTVWGGGRLNAANTKYTGTIDVNLDSVYLNTASGSWASFNGGVYVTNGSAEVRIPSTSDRKGVEVNITNTKFKTRVVGAGYMSNGGDVYADAHMVLGAGNTYGSELYGGAYVGNGSSKYVGSSILEINGGTMNKVAHGGSYVGKTGAMHEGNSQIILQTGTISTSSYGGSYLVEAGTKHIGNSEILMNNGSITASPYGGSRFTGADGSTYNATTHGEWGHIGGSGITVNDGSITGSIYLFGGSHMSTDSASVQTGMGIHGIQYQPATESTPEVKASKTYVIFNGGSFTGVSINGGAYLGKPNSVMYGDVEVNLAGGGTFYAQEQIAAVYTAGGNNAVYGNTKVVLNNVTVAKHSSVKTGHVIGGVFGTGKLYGNSSLELYGTAKINWQIDAGVITAGCCGTNDITENSSTAGINEPYGGTRQYGDVKFVMADKSQIGQYVSVSGHKSNVEGNTIIDISGSPKLSTYLYGLCRRFTIDPSDSKNGYASITGDMKVYLTGSITPSYNLLFGSTHASGKSPNNGVNIVGGDIYVEMNNFTPNMASGKYIALSGFAPKGSAILKLVGNTNISSTTVKFHEWDIGYGANVKRVLDLTQYTGTLNSSDLPGTIIASGTSGSKYTYTTLKPIKDANLSFDASSLNVGDAFSSIIADSYTYNGQTIKYADLTQYDEYANSPNAFKFYSKATGEEIKNLEFATTDVIVKCGDIQIGTITLEAIGNAVAEEKFALESNFMFTGNSFRMPDPSRGRTLALRCRAYVDPTFLGEYATLKNGFKIAEIGMLVSVKPTYSTTEMVYDGAGVSKAVAYKDGECVIDGGWDVVDGKYYYAAAITGYEDQNGVIAERVVASIYTRAYIVYADANGDTLVYYYDLPESASAGEIISGEGFNQYRTSLYDRAKYEKDRQTSDYQTYMSKFEEILACKQA